MLRFVIALHTYAQDAAAQMVARWLKERFSDTEGICYHRHPAVMTSTGAFPDFILFTKENHPLVIKTLAWQLQEIELVGEEFWIINNESIDPCPGYLDYPFQNKRFGHGSLAHFSNLQRLIFSKTLVF
jgi:hypothetical protein